MVGAWVVEIDADDKRIARGFHEFVQLPLSGDRIAIAGQGDMLDIMGVLYVEHFPAPIPQGASNDPPKEPVATVYVQWLAEQKPGGRRWPL